MRTVNGRVERPPVVADGDGEGEGEGELALTDGRAVAVALGPTADGLAGAVGAGVGEVPQAANVSTVMTSRATTDKATRGGIAGAYQTANIASRGVALLCGPLKRRAERRARSHSTCWRWVSGSGYWSP
jgi:hypothetical protein